MQVLIKRDLVTRSQRIFRSGRQMELPDGEARILIRRGVAEAVRPKPKKRAARKRKPTPDGEAGTEHGSQ